MLTATDSFETSRLILYDDESPSLELPALKTSLVAILFAVAIACGATIAAERSLPKRTSPSPATTSGVPHVQIGVEAVREVQAELLRHVSALPKVDVRPTVVSLPGAIGFWLLEDLQLSHSNAQSVCRRVIS